MCYMNSARHLLSFYYAPRSIFSCLQKPREACEFAWSIFSGRFPSLFSEGKFKIFFVFFSREGEREVERRRQPLISCFCGEGGGRFIFCEARRKKIEMPKKLLGWSKHQMRGIQFCGASVVATCFPIPKFATPSSLRYPDSGGGEAKRDRFQYVRLLFHSCPTKRERDSDSPLLTHFFEEEAQIGCWVTKGRSGEGGQVN